MDSPTFDTKQRTLMPELYASRNRFIGKTGLVPNTLTISHEFFDDLRRELAMDMKFSPDPKQYKQVFGMVVFITSDIIEYRISYALENQ